MLWSIVAPILVVGLLYCFSPCIAFLSTPSGDCLLCPLFTLLKSGHQNRTGLAPFWPSCPTYTLFRCWHQDCSSSKLGGALSSFLPILAVALSHSGHMRPLAQRLIAQCYCMPTHCQLTRHCSHVQFLSRVKGVVQLYLMVMAWWRNHRSMLESSCMSLIISV